MRFTEHFIQVFVERCKFFRVEGFGRSGLLVDLTEPILKELLEWESDDDVQNDRPAKRKQSNDYGQMSLFDFLDDDKDDGGDDE